MNTVQEALEAYDESLDEVNGDFMGYSASWIFKEVDPIAYRVGFSDYLYSMDIDGEDLTGWNGVDL